VTLILASPYRRALETARLLSRATRAAVEEEPGLASGRSSGREILELARARGPGVALVGHNPELGEAVALAAGGRCQVPPGTIAAVALREGAAELVWLRNPP